MPQAVRQEDPGLEQEIQTALTEWVNSLAPEEAQRRVVWVSGEAYSPGQILQHVEKKTAFGEEFVNGLCDVHRWMNESETGSSVVELIRRSTDLNYKKNPKILISPSELVYETNLDVIERGIGAAAGTVRSLLEARREIMTASLPVEVPIDQPFLDWAIGWLAREGKIVVALGKEPGQEQDDIGTTAGKIWRALEPKGGLVSMAALQGEIGATRSLFGWAIGWLAREGKLTITQDTQWVRIRLKAANKTA